MPRRTIASLVRTLMEVPKTRREQQCENLLMLLADPTGPCGRGATVEDCMQVSRLGRDVVVPALEGMVSEGFVQRRGSPLAYSISTLGRAHLAFSGR